MLQTLVAIYPPFGKTPRQVSSERQNQVAQGLTEGRNLHCVLTIDRSQSKQGQYIRTTWDSWKWDEV
jgi:hypothetical protein